MEMKSTEIEWILCSTKVDDIVHNAPKGWNTIKIESTYHETSVKNAKSVYLTYARSTQEKTQK